MGKYKKGDKVVIRKDLEVGKWYGGRKWFAGKEYLKEKEYVVIDVVVDSDYWIEDWFWITDEMIKPFFDIEKIKGVCKRLGYQLEVNSNTPGIHYKTKDGIERSVTFDEILKDLEDEFSKKKTKKTLGELCVCQKQSQLRANVF